MSSGSFTTQLFTLTGFAFGCLGHEFLRHITGEQTDFFIQMLDIHGIGNAYIESSYFEIHAETTKLHFGLFSIHSYIFTPDDWSIQWGMRDEDSLEFYIRSAAPFNKHKYKRRKSYHLRSMLLLVALRWIRKTTIVSNSAFSFQLFTYPEASTTCHKTRSTSIWELTSIPHPSHRPQTPRYHQYYTSDTRVLPTIDFEVPNASRRGLQFRQGC